MCRRILLILVFCVSLVLICQKSNAAYLQNVIPGNLENDPNFRKLFPHISSTNNVDTRIVGGLEVIPHSRPYQVGLITPVTVGGTYFCGGSLLNARTILTAAHCVDLRAGNTTVYFGAHRMYPAESENAITITTNDVVVYPYWNRSILLNDIAIIRLEHPVQLSERISPILLPRDRTRDYLGNTSLVTGWGRPIETVPGISPVLKELTSYIISNYACRLAYFGYVEESNICMATTIGESTCSGDSGGPLVVNGVQIGVVSFGSGYGCSQGFPAVFARVTYYLDWINENLAFVPASTTTTSTTSSTTSTTPSTTTSITTSTTPSTTSTTISTTPSATTSSTTSTIPITSSTTTSTTTSTTPSTTTSTTTNTTPSTTISTTSSTTPSTTTSTTTSTTPDNK